MKFWGLFTINMLRILFTYYVVSLHNYPQRNFFSGLGTRNVNVYIEELRGFLCLDTVNCVTTCTHPFSLANIGAQSQICDCINFTISTLCTNFILGSILSFFFKL